MSDFNKYNYLILNETINLDKNLSKNIINTPNLTIKEMCIIIKAAPKDSYRILCQLLHECCCPEIEEWAKTDEIKTNISSELYEDVINKALEKFDI
jgi:hypothetical protein